MPGTLVTHSFSAGEISPKLLGRGDLDVYDQALALARNFRVTLTGALETRPGSRFVETLQADTRRVRMFGFDFGTDLHNTYVLLFGNNYIRFVQDGVLLFHDITNNGLKIGDLFKVKGVSRMYYVDASGVRRNMNNNRVASYSW